MSSYSTILQCDEGATVCGLRVAEGLISLALFWVLLKGYRHFSREQVLPLSAEDKTVYMLAMAQTLALALYYFLFEEFFVLATMRNLLIWTALNVLHLLSQMLWIDDEPVLQKVAKAMIAGQLLNFASWFFIALGEGSSLANADFPLGYNCRVIDWMSLSGLLLLVSAAQAYVGWTLYDKLTWELGQLPQDGAEKTRSTITKQRFDVVLLAASGFACALIMFLWDYLAFVLADSDESCTALFSGNSFFRSTLCFLLKLVTMQLNPCVIYYTLYYSRDIHLLPTAASLLHDDFLNDDAASDFNRTVTSRRSSFAGDRRDQSNY